MTRSYYKKILILKLYKLPQKLVESCETSMLKNINVLKLQFTQVTLLLMKENKPHIQKPEITCQTLILLTKPHFSICTPNDPTDIFKIKNTKTYKYKNKYFLERHEKAQNTGERWLNCIQICTNTTNNQKYCQHLISPIKYQNLEQYFLKVNEIHFHFH